jgi:hypothetical protein
LALKSRDESIKTNSKAEIALWTQYNRLYKLAKSDPTKIPVVQDQLNAIILDYRDKLIATQNTRNANPYAAPNILQDCKEKHD